MRGADALGFAKPLEMKIMNNPDNLYHMAMALHHTMQNAVPKNGRYGHIPIVILAYLYVHGPSLSKSIEDALCITQPTVHRTAKFLREGKCVLRDGKHSWHGAISTVRDPADPRRCIHSITTKGKALLRDAVAPMAAGSAFSLMTMSADAARK